MKTSDEWQKEFPYPKVLDPDGWDRTNFRFSWYEETITKEEYEKRVSVSTCMFKILSKEEVEKDRCKAYPYIF